MIRVLVADKHPIVGYGIRMLFESSSAIKIVKTVGTQKQILEALKKGSIDVILMSLDLADINGITVLRNIKKNFNLCSGKDALETHKVIDIIKKKNNYGSK